MGTAAGLEGLRVVIDGIERLATRGTTLLQAATQAGIVIPSVCADPRMEPLGTCRLCCVEVEGQANFPIACRTPVRDGMRVRTRSPGLEAYRRMLLGWMAAHVSAEAMAAEPQKALHRLLAEHGIAPVPGPCPTAAPDLSHPHIRVDMSQCIDCLRCVHICGQLQGQFVWHAVDRGEATRIVTDRGGSLAESSCVACGACVDTCPTGALTDRSEVTGDAIAGWTRTTCVYCGVGCELEVGVAAGRVVRALPCKDSPVNKGHACSKGRYAHTFAASPDRLRQPLVRQGGGWQPLSWDEALDRCAAELGRITATHGPDSVGVVGSARATNEDNYLLQKFARLVLGTNNVDCCARVCHAPSAAAMKAVLGTGAATNSFDDIERAKGFLVFGANPLEAHPVVGARIRQQVLRRGAGLVVVDPRKTELSKLASVHLQLRPGTNIPLLNALAHVIVTEGWADLEFIAARVAGWEAFREWIAAWPPARAAALCDVSEADIRAAARLYATQGPAMSFHGLGLTEHRQGTEGVMALVNLALLTGNLGKPGAGVNPLRGQNNVQGAAVMGCEPELLTGSAPIEERRDLFEQVWRKPIPRRRGMNLMAMLDAAAAGRLKALWVVGYDLLATLPELDKARRALSQLECVIVQDLFLTETARAAGSIVLPVASVFEKDGTFMNAERRVQRVRKAVDAPPDVPADWEIACALAQRMGCGEHFRHASAEEIWDEVRQVWPAVGGMSYGRLEDHGLQWPCRDEGDAGTPILHVDQFAHGKKAALQRIDHAPTPERTSGEFPLLLTTGRHLYQFNAGTMTMRTANASLRPTDTLDIAAVDAARLGITDGSAVHIESRHGAAVMTARVSEAVRPGELFASFHDARVALNRVIGPHRDGITHTPEYKVTAVRLGAA